MLYHYLQINHKSKQRSNQLYDKADMEDEYGDLKPGHNSCTGNKVNATNNKPLCSS